MGRKYAAVARARARPGDGCLAGGLLQPDLPVALVRLEGVEYGGGYRLLRRADVAAPDLLHEGGGGLVDVVAREDRGDQLLSQVWDRFGADAQDLAGVRVRLQLHAYHGGGIAWGKALRQAGVADKDDA